MSASGAPIRDADHIIAEFSRDALSAALAATHRAGFGPQTRVFDGARGDVARQVERAGLRLIEGGIPAADAVLIVVTAPGRTAQLVDLFHRLGAESVSLASRREADREIAPEPTLLTPDIRLGDTTVPAADG
jgi:hypothetical protein